MTKKDGGWWCRKEGAWGADRHPMREALRLAKRAGDHLEVPVGAVLVWSNQIVARAHNQVERWRQPLAHAEMICMIQGLKKIGPHLIKEAHLYVTLSPCPMCAHALGLVGIKRVYFGAYAHRVAGSSPEYIGGLEEGASSFLLAHFFKRIRSFD